jgi:hypothetical protein
MQDKIDALEEENKEKDKRLMELQLLCERRRNEMVHSGHLDEVEGDTSEWLNTTVFKDPKVVEEIKKNPVAWAMMKDQEKYLERAVEGKSPAGMRWHPLYDPTLRTRYV